MPDEPTIFEFDLGEHGERLVFKTPDELQKWAEEERQEWRWVSDVTRTQTEDIGRQHDTLRGALYQTANEWKNNLAHPGEVRRIFKNLEEVFTSYYKNERVLHSKSAKGEFVFGLKEKRGPVVAAAAYINLVSSTMYLRDALPPEFWDGMIEGFLFKREVDWTARAHARALNQLKKEYQEEAAKQIKRAAEIEGNNLALNETFQTTLTAKAAALDKLHGDHDKEFKRLTEEHIKNLKGIEDAYNQKLALQKPVEYWKTREDYHGKRSTIYGLVALVAGLVAAAGMGRIVWWIFKALPANENPRHWQIGMLIVAAFFSIWLVRIFVRLFFSHLHLATDAAERQTMILTYLSMAREGEDVKPEDKKLILQHIFRSASDGLVKDDAAPPTVLEYLTRGK